MAHLDYRKNASLLNRFVPRFLQRGPSAPPTQTEAEHGVRSDFFQSIHELKTQSESSNPNLSESLDRYMATVAEGKFECPTDRFSQPII
jgi:hypothetical protein